MVRGGKRYGRKRVWSGTKSYMIEIVECQIRISGKKYGTSYSIERHGTVGANARADAWLKKKRVLAAKADKERAALRGSKPRRGTI